MLYVLRTRRVRPPLSVGPPSLFRLNAFQLHKRESTQTETPTTKIVRGQEVAGAPGPAMEAEAESAPSFSRPKRCVFWLPKNQTEAAEERIDRSK